MVNWEEVGFGCGGCDSTLGRDRQLHIASDWCSSASALHLRATSTAKDVGLCAERDLAAAKATIGAGFAKDITPADWAWFKDHAALIDALVNRVPTFTKPPASSQYAAIRTKCTDLMQAVKEADLTSAIPSQSAQRDWTKALSSFTDVANDCLDGIHSRDQPLLAQVAPEARTAGNWLSLLVFGKPLPASEPYGTHSVQTSPGA
jgi:hypothetical protein